MSNLVVNLVNANKFYGKQQVLNNINIKLKQGIILGLIGPSGSGKTTTIKSIMGMEKLDSGNVKVFDKSIPNIKVLTKIGYMGQTDALYETLTAKENLEFFGKLYGMKNKNLQEAIEKNIKLVNLTEHINKRVSNFSGGMKRRLSLAISLLTNPELIILDEPTVGIDPSLRKEIWIRLRELANDGKTIIITTHVMDEAEKCDEVGLIIKGKLAALEKPTTLINNYGAKNIEEVFLKIEEAINNEI